MSDKPEGNVEDNLEDDRDLLGTIPSASGDVDILVDRVQRRKQRPIWMFSYESLQAVPRLYNEVEPVWFEQYVPEWLRTKRWFSVPLYHWIRGLLFLFLILGIGSILTRLLTALLRPILRRMTREQDDSRLARIVWPLRLLVLALLL